MTQIPPGVKPAFRTGRTAAFAEIITYPGLDSKGERRARGKPFRFQSGTASWIQILNLGRNRDDSTLNVKPLADSPQWRMRGEIGAQREAMELQTNLHGKDGGIPFDPADFVKRLKRVRSKQPNPLI